MLKIYDVMLEAVLMMRGTIEAIDRRDADLAQQIRRAASSVVLTSVKAAGRSDGCAPRGIARRSGRRARPEPACRSPRRSATSGPCPMRSGRSSIASSERS